MGLYLGSTDIEGASFYLGSNAVTGLYLGSNDLLPAGQVTTGLQAYYDANNWTSGLWVDEANGNDLTLNGPSSTGTDAGGGKYFHFNDGSNSAYKTSMPSLGYGSDGTGDITMEFIIQMIGSPAWDRLSGFWGSGNLVFTFNSNSSGQFAPIYAGFSLQAEGVPTTITNSTWYHMIWTINSSNEYSIWQNGSLVGSNTNGYTPQAWPSAAADATGKTFAIGNYDSSNNGNFYMGVYRMYNITFDSTLAAQQYSYWSGTGLYTGI